MTRKFYRAVAEALVRTDASDFTIGELAAILNLQANFELARFYKYIHTLRNTARAA